MSGVTGSRGDPPAPDWAPCGCSVQPGRPVCGHTGMEQGHGWCPEGKKEETTQLFQAMP